MRNWIILMLMLTFFTFHDTAYENVYWDGVEVVKGQTGKLTFSKSVKVYKQNAQGEFESLVVPKGNFFRVYTIEKYNGQTYYWMSSGYRVQKTDLVIFKEVPFDIRRDFYKNPVTVNTSRNPVNVEYNLASSGNSYSLYRDNFFYGQIINLNGSLNLYSDEVESLTLKDATDVTFVEKTEVKDALYYVKEDTVSYDNPLGAINKNTRSLEKGTVIQTHTYNYLMNGYLQSTNISDDTKFDPNKPFINTFIPVTKLEKATSKGMYYAQRAIEVSPFTNYTVYLKRNDQIEVIATYKNNSYVSYNGQFYKIPSNLLNVLPSENVAEVTDTLIPATSVQNLTYYAKGDSFEVTRKGNVFTDKDLTIQYEENKDYFIMKIQDVKYTFKKPIQEQSIVTIDDGASSEVKVLAIYPTLTDLDDIYKNAIVLDNGTIYVPQYGVLYETKTKIATLGMSYRNQFINK